MEELSQRKWRAAPTSIVNKSGVKFVSFRKRDMQFNAELMVQVSRNTVPDYVRIDVDDKNFALLFTFMTQAEYEAACIATQSYDGLFRLLQDGGKSVLNTKAKKRNRLIVCSGLINSAGWIRAIAHAKDPAVRRFLPRKVGPNQYLLECIPNYTHTQPIEGLVLPQFIKGLYQYEDENGKILYIGEGIIKNRFAYHKNVDGFKAAVFKWVVVPDESMRKRAENHHLELYVAKHGVLPFYNSNKGRSKG